MVLPLLYTTTKILLMLLALQVVTIVFILALLSKAVLAAVVIQAPLIAFGSHAGVGGVTGGVGVGLDPPPFEQLKKLKKSTTIIKDLLIIGIIL